MSAGLRLVLRVVLRLMEVSTLPVLLKKSMMPAPGLRDAEPLNGGLPPPGSIHAAGSWMVPAQADAASHASIPHVTTKRLMNILRPLSNGSQHISLMVTRAGGPSQPKRPLSKDDPEIAVPGPAVFLGGFLLNSRTHCANSGVLRRLASSGSPLISSRE